MHAEKVVLEKFKKEDEIYLNSSLQLKTEKELEEIKKTNELRERLSKLPNFSVILDEVHHSYGETDEGEKKLRQAVNILNQHENINTVLGLSGTPYVKTTVKIDDRAKNANLPAFSPHKYRHLSIYLALQKCQNGLEIKAISQHFGHEDIRTALEVYGNLSSVQLSNTLENINNNSLKEDQEQLNLAMKLLSSIKDNNKHIPSTDIF